MILELVRKFIDVNEVLFITSNINSRDSDDIDIYCVTKYRSSVHLFYNEENVWTELFVDRLEDALAKIENMDEIAINFIQEMEFLYGDRELFGQLKFKAEQSVLSYSIPDDRKNIIKYRIKVLLSKYLNPNKKNTEIQNRFIVNSLTYPLIQLILEHHGIFPSSPKKWMLQLESALDKKEFNEISRFISGELDSQSVLNLCSKYVGVLSAINLDKSENNDTTFIS